MGRSRSLRGDSFTGISARGPAPRWSLLYLSTISTSVALVLTVGPFAGASYGTEQRAARTASSGAVSVRTATGRAPSLKNRDAGTQVTFGSSCLLGAPGACDDADPCTVTSAIP